MKFLNVLLACASVGFLFASSAEAEPLVAIGTGMSFETATDGHSIQTQTPFALRGGYRFSLADAYLEYSQFRSSEGNHAIFVSRQHEEWLMWGRYIFRSDWIVSPYVGAGLGFQQETVDTSFGHEVSKDTGDAQTLAAMAMGARAILVKNIELGLEVRASFSSTYQPNPVVSLGATAGWLF